LELEPEDPSDHSGCPEVSPSGHAAFAASVAAQSEVEGQPDGQEDLLGDPDWRRDMPPTAIAVIDSLSDWQESEVHLGSKTAGEGNDWYANMAPNDRAFADSMADWVGDVPWQLFCTFTFPWNVSRKTADMQLRLLLNDLESHLKTQICFLAGKEMKPPSLGIGVPYHFHVLMAAHYPIPADQVAETWRHMVGKGKITPLCPEGDSALVTLFDERQRGVQYCVKRANCCHGDWSFRWLELFSSKIPLSGSMTHRKIRQRKRSLLRAQPVNCDELPF